MNIETINGRDFSVTIENDDCMGAPWDEHGGHGTVSEWTTRNKAPGELELCEDCGSRRFYDYAQAVKTARVDGWGSKNCTPNMSAGQKAAQAALDDFKYLRGYANGNWSWVSINAAMRANRTHVHAWLSEYRAARAAFGMVQFPQLCETALRALQRELDALNEMRARALSLRALNAGVAA